MDREGEMPYDKSLVRENMVSTNTIAFSWFIFGAMLIVLEFIVPGAILSFVGVAAVMVGGLYYFGIISSVIHGFIYWFILSIGLVLFLRSFVLRFMPSDVERSPLDDDDNAQGLMAEVVEEIKPGRPGRIRFRGTTWEAIGEGHYGRGQEVAIAGREGNVWRVEGIDL